MTKLDEQNAEILLLKLFFILGLKGVRNWILNIIQLNICEHSYPELVDIILSLRNNIFRDQICLVTCIKVFI